MLHIEIENLVQRDHGLIEWIDDLPVCFLVRTQRAVMFHPKVVLVEGDALEPIRLPGSPPSLLATARRRSGMIFLELISILHRSTLEDLADKDIATSLCIDISWTQPRANLQHLPPTRQLKQ
jgi:hypothetical protein